jgi:HPt (histidine-containing phosphotransfer) domain-containing protein
MTRSSSLRIQPIFDEAPAAASRERPVDLVHLSHQTMGDEALECEILGLLARQISTFSGRLATAGAEERRRVAHALKGACLNVGAFRLATAAEALECDPNSSSALGGFEAEMTVAADFVAGLLRR